MKKQTIILLCVAIASLCACSKENSAPADPSTKTPVVINSDLSKTYLEYESGSYKSKWYNGDQIAVFVDGTGESVSMSNTAVSGAKASFSGEISATAGSHTLNAFYPYAAVTASAGKVDVTIPYEQNPEWDSFDPAADLLVAKPVGVTVESGTPVSVSTNFSRLLAVVKIELKNLDVLEAGETVQYLTFTNSGNVPVTGTFTLDLNEEENPVLGANVTKNHVAQINFPETSGSGTVFMNIAPCTFASGNVLTFTVVTSKGKVFISNKTLTQDMTVKSAQDGTLSTFRVTLGSFAEPEYETGLYMSNKAQNWDVSTWGSSTTYNGYDTEILWSSTIASSKSLNISAVTYDENCEKGWVKILTGRGRGNSGVAMTANTGMARKAYLWGTIANSGKIARVTLLQAPGSTMFDYMIPPTNDGADYGYGVSLFSGAIQNYGTTTKVEKWVNTAKTDADMLFSKDKFFRKYIWQNTGGNIKDDIVLATMSQENWREIYNGFSVEAIVKSFDAKSVRSVVLGGGNDRGSGVAGLNFERLSGTTHWGMYFWTSAGRQKIDFEVDVEDNAQEHLIAVVNPSNNSVKLYKNGVLASTKSYTGTISDTEYPVATNGYLLVPGTAGTYITTKYSVFHGEVYQVRIYNKVLTAEEVATAYNAEGK